MQLSNFTQMWSAYPHGDAADVKARIGGKVDYDWIVNTCTIRLSHALHYAGHLVPSDHPGLSTVPGADGRAYAFRVREFRRWLEQTYGAATVTRDFALGEAVPDALAGKSGLVAFTVPVWDDASGHFDLRGGKAAAHKAYFEVSTRVELWQTPAEPLIAGSVGAGGDNAPDDTAMVQHLLSGRGGDPGPVDGHCGGRTVAAIRAFQADLMAHPDGRVDVGGRTWQALGAV